MWSGPNEPEPTEWAGGRGTSSNRVASACQRCRRLKHKCDIQRPCTLCARAGASCVPGDAASWKVYLGRVTKPLPSASPNARKQQPLPSPSPFSGDYHTSRDSHVASTEGVTISGGSVPRHESPIPDSAFNEATWNSSSTVVLVEEAFHYHDSDTPSPLEISAYSTGIWKHDENLPSRPTKALWQRNPSPGFSSPTARELLKLLPQREPATILLNTYFDRVHWFMLLFHQQDFRAKFAQLYDHLYVQRAPAAISDFTGFLSTLLATFAIAIQHAGEYRKSLLLQAGLDPNALQEKILATLNFRLIEILSLGSLEAVQTCVLLGSYHLYHGRPDLAWPICGCGLRIAQALNLHRKMRLLNSSADIPAVPAYRLNEARKRVWWAVYEIETVCSMLYGYPLSISDSDCDVEWLDYSTRQPLNNPPSDTQLSGEATLLSYKYLMSKLSMIIRVVLTDLYGSHRNLPAKVASSATRNARLHQLVQKVAELDQKLCSWYESVPCKLKLDDLPSSPSAQWYVEEIEKTLGASGERFESYIFGLQALALKLAFENTRILIHRPLLSYKMITPSNTSEWPSNPPQTLQITDPFQSSIETCRDAALRTAEVGKLPVFTYASTTFAAAFFGMHLFTAGVTLCVMTSLEPLSLRAYETKMGVRSLMTMQVSLKESSILAAQGLDLLKKLTKVVLRKETEEMFEFTAPAPGRDFPVPHPSNDEPPPQLTEAPRQHRDDTQSIDSQSHNARQTRLAPARDESTGSFQHTTQQPDNHTFEQGNIDFDENTTVARTLLDLENGKISSPIS
ncbi:Fungal specific transcription factor domain-containing protein isoform 3 [Cladophialophora immunda]|nr:Fungal specific transcription factor domain-containing protein isoform 3 [Cladophialophora immunda]